MKGHTMTDTTTKRGRKPLSATNEKRTIVSTSLDEKTYKALAELRWSKRIESMGELVRAAIVAFIDAPAEDAPVEDAPTAE